MSADITLDMAAIEAGAKAEYEQWRGWERASGRRWPTWERADDVARDNRISERVEIIFDYLRRTSGAAE